MTQFSRRRALQFGALGTAAAFLPGCKSSAGTASGPKGGAVAVPKHFPAPAIEGELRSKVAGLPSAYAKIPQPLRKAWDTKPGDGTSMSMFTIVWEVPAPNPPGNVYWTELNKRLGLELKMIWGQSDSYDAKLATLLASGDLPDVTVLLPNPTSDKALRQGAFADLSDYLGGDAIKDYPNLSNNMSEQAWKDSMVDGRILGVTNPVPAADTAFVYRADWAKTIGFDKAPANAEELKKYFVEVHKAVPRAYGIGAFPGPVMGLVLAMFRAGPEWKVDGGKVVNRLDSPEYEAAIAWCRDVWSAGGYHPDALALDAQEIKAIDLFTSNQLAVTKNGAMAPFTVTDPLHPLMSRGDGAMLLPPGHDGGKAAWVKTTGWFSRWGIAAKHAKNPDRIKALLRTLDWLNAGFGTEEYMFNRFGMEGRHWNYNAKHEPVQVDNANLQAELAGLGQYPHAYYFPGNPTGYKDVLAYSEALLDGAVEDPIASIQSPVAERVNGVLKKITTDYINQIVSGRRPMSDLQKCRADWHQRGGDQLRADYERQLSTR